jgi:hypothetical protein
MEGQVMSVTDPKTGNEIQIVIPNEVFLQQTQEQIVETISNIIDNHLNPPTDGSRNDRKTV